MSKVKSMVGKVAKCPYNNINVIGSKPRVVIFKILFLRVCTLYDLVVGPI